MAETTTILKYELQGSSAIRERPSFDFEFQQTIYVVLE